MNEVGEDLLDENAWQLEEEQYDWEPPSDTEQEAEEAAAEQEVEEPAASAIQEEEAAAGGDEEEAAKSDDEAVADWEYQSPSEPPSVMPAAGADGGTSEEEVGGPGPLEFVLEEETPPGSPGYSEPDYDGTYEKEHVEEPEPEPEEEPEEPEEPQQEEEDEEDGEDVKYKEVIDDGGGSDDDASVVSFDLIAAPRFALNEESKKRQEAQQRAEMASRVKRVEAPPRYGTDALVDERPMVSHNELPALKAQLRALGPMGQQLQALALKHAAAARRTHKHTPAHQRDVVTEDMWWDCLLQSLGLPSLEELGRQLSAARDEANLAAASAPTAAGLRAPQEIAVPQFLHGL